MMIRKGFVLLEIVIALFIGSLISGMLFQSLVQSNQIFAKTTNINLIARKIAIVQQQIETDFSGICFVPDIFEKKEEQKESQDKKNTDIKKEPLLDDKKTLKGCVLNYGQGGLLELFSFVTTNPLLTYKQGSPRVVRVAYRIIKDSENEGNFLLVRQQSEELVLEKFEQASRAATRKDDQKPIRSFEVLRNIKSFSCTPFVELIKKQEEKKSWQTSEQKAQEKEKNKKPEQKDENKEQQKSRSFIVAQEWFAYSDEEKNKFETPVIPVFIKIEISVIDNFQKPQTFEFWCAAAGGFGIFEREGATELPSDHELYQREAANKEDRRIHLNNGIPQL